MTMLTTPDTIHFAQLCAWRGALNLECKGMKRRGRSVYSIVKEQLGFKGNKERVLKQLEDYIEKHRPNPVRNVGQDRPTDELAAARKLREESTTSSVGSPPAPDRHQQRAPVLTGTYSQGDMDRLLNGVLKLIATHCSHDELSVRVRRLYNEICLLP